MIPLSDEVPTRPPDPQPHPSLSEPSGGQPVVSPAQSPGKDSSQSENRIKNNTPYTDV